MFTIGEKQEYYLKDVDFMLQKSIILSGLSLNHLIYKQ